MDRQNKICVNYDTIMDIIGVDSPNQSTNSCINCHLNTYLKVSITKHNIYNTTFFLSF